MSGRDAPIGYPGADDLEPHAASPVRPPAGRPPSPQPPARRSRAGLALVAVEFVPAHLRRRRPAASPALAARRPPARRPTGRPRSRAWPPPATASSSTSRSPRSGSPPSSTTAAATTWSPLTPSGHQHNADLLTRISNMLTGESNSSGPGYYIDSSGKAPRPARSTSARWPARARTPRRRPVVSVQPYVISGKTYGSVIQIQPSTAPTLILTITNVNARPRSSLASGDRGRDPAGHIIDLRAVLTQELAKYTSDAGNHVHVEVTRAPATAPDPLDEEARPNRTK